MEMKTRIKEAGAKAWKFAKENKLFMLRLGIMATVVFSSCDVGLAKTAGGAIGADAELSGNWTKDASDKYWSALTQPVSQLSAMMTGPIPKVIGTVGVGVLGLSTAMSFENQVSKRAIQLLGGCGAAVGGASLINVAGGDGFTFM